MSRIPHAARTLIQQVTEAKPKATAEPHGDPDGLDVQRTIRFNKATSKWLAPILEHMGDPRIEEVEMTDAGYLHVTFVPTVDADGTQQFPLSAAEQVSKQFPVETGDEAQDPEDSTASQ